MVSLVFSVLLVKYDMFFQVNQRVGTQVADATYVDRAPEKGKKSQFYNQMTYLTILSTSKESKTKMVSQITGQKCVLSMKGRHA